MGGCTSRPDKDVVSVGQAPQRVEAVPTEDAAARIRKLEEENQILKAQLAAFNTRATVMASPSSPEPFPLSPMPFPKNHSNAPVMTQPQQTPLPIPSFEKTNAFALSFTTPQRTGVDLNNPPTPPPSRAPPSPPDSTEFYPRHVLPSPSSLFRSTVGQENPQNKSVFKFEPDLNDILDTSLDSPSYDGKPHTTTTNEGNKNLTSPSPPPSLFTLHSVRSPSTVPFTSTGNFSFASSSPPQTTLTTTTTTSPAIESVNASSSLDSFSLPPSRVSIQKEPSTPPPPLVVITTPTSTPQTPLSSTPTKRPTKLSIRTRTSLSPIPLTDETAVTDSSTTLITSAAGVVTTTIPTVTTTTTATVSPAPATTTTANTPALTPCSAPRASLSYAYEPSPKLGSPCSSNVPLYGSPDSRHRTFGGGPVPISRRRSSASLCAGIAAAAAALSASSPNLLLTPKQHSTPLPSRRLSRSLSVDIIGGGPLDKEAKAVVEKEDWTGSYGDESPPSRSSRTSNLETPLEDAFDTHDELYDCSDEETEPPGTSEELPPVTRPLARALAVARDVRMKLLHKYNAIEGLTRIKDAHFLNAKSKLIPPSHFNGKVLGLFLVGSQSLARCTEVLPDVVRWYQAAVSSRSDFEVVLVWLSASILDPSGGGFGAASQEYEQIRKLAPFPAAPFNSPMSVALYNLFCHKGTPSLVIIDTDGAIINTNGLKSEARQLRVSEDLGPFPFRPDFDNHALELFKYLDTDGDGILTRAELLAQSDNQESGEYVYEKLLLESEGGPITPKVWSALLLTQLRASAGHQSDMEEILDSFQDIFCFRPDSMSPAHVLSPAHR